MDYQKEMMEEALERVVSKTTLPGSFFLKLMRDLKLAYTQHERDTQALQKVIKDKERALAQFLRENEAIKNAHGKDAATFQKLINKAESLIGQYETAVQNALALKEGRPGKDVDDESIFQRLLAKLPKPKDGKNAVIKDEHLRKVAAMVKTDTLDYDRLLDLIKEKLTVKDIPGLSGEIASYRNQLAGKQYGKDTWARGGGDTVSAGTNVTITALSDGTKRISASGGGASSPLTPTGTVNAVNTVFGVLSQPASVVSDGITYFEGFGYSYAALNITLDVPPSQFIRYYA